MGLLSKSVRKGVYINEVRKGIRQKRKRGGAKPSARLLRLTGDQDAGVRA